MMKFTQALLCSLYLTVAGCGAGPIGGESQADADPPENVPDMPEEGVLGDPWHCGELGLVCVGPLGIGACIDGECGPKLGYQCWGTKFAPTCDDYCEAFELSCAYQGCEDATVWGWLGEPAWADNMCLDAHKATAMPLAVACDDPLEGLLTSFNCCCE